MKEQNETGQIPFSTGAHILKKNSDEIKYQIECDTPKENSTAFFYFGSRRFAYTCYRSWSWSWYLGRCQPHGGLWQ